jgi:hypothetical protein
MQWMIDGANGDFYRKAMGYPELQPAVDEWDIERNLHHTMVHRKNHGFPFLTASLSRVRDSLTALVQATTTLRAHPERNVP